MGRDGHRAAIEGPARRVTNAGRPLTLSPGLVTKPLDGAEGGDATRAVFEQWFNRENFNSSSVLERDLASMMATGTENLDEFTQAIRAAAGLSTVFPDTQRGNQMRTVAETIAIRNVLNASRHVFYAAIGGWDTHDNQASDLDNKHPELAGTMTAFRDAMIELGQWNTVTIFSGFTAIMFLSLRARFRARLSAAAACAAFTVLFETISRAQHQDWMLGAASRYLYIESQ